MTGFSTNIAWIHGVFHKYCLKLENINNYIIYAKLIVLFISECVNYNGSEEGQEQQTVRCRNGIVQSLPTETYERRDRQSDQGNSQGKHLQSFC